MCPGVVTRRLLSSVVLGASKVKMPGPPKAKSCSIGATSAFDAVKLFDANQAVVHAHPCGKASQPVAINWVAWGAKPWWWLCLRAALLSCIQTQVARPEPLVAPLLPKVKSVVAR